MKDTSITVAISISVNSAPGQEVHRLICDRINGWSQIQNLVGVVACMYTDTNQALITKDVTEPLPLCENVS